MPKLSEAHIDAALSALPGWERSEAAGGQAPAIKKTYEFRTFAQAMSWVNLVAQMAEEADHHPDIDIRYAQVRLALSTHTARGITEKDVLLAERIDELPRGQEEQSV